MITTTTASANGLFHAVLVSPVGIVLVSRAEYPTTWDALSAGLDASMSGKLAGFDVAADVTDVTVILPDE
jgi:hypothetical protein